MSARVPGFLVDNVSNDAVSAIKCGGFTLPVSALTSKSLCSKAGGMLVAAQVRCQSPVF